MSREDSGKDAWAPEAKGNSIAPISTEPPSLMDLDDGPESPAWDEPEPIVHEMPVNHAAEVQQLNNDTHAWDEDIGSPKTGPFSRETPRQEDWNLIDQEPEGFGAQDSGIISSSGVVQESSWSQERAPDLPPRPSQEFAPPQPPRPVMNSLANESSTSILTPSSNARSQKKETYEIKKISWHDTNSSDNPRISPILVQNANGPCPLLALVNALTLSTPANVETALVDALRSREQVSLGLLLDAVFDELMSGRRGDAAQDLPDVGDLYSFLVTLHTGMNVNPRFFPPPPTQSKNDPRNSMSHVHPSEREGSIPGTFEDTREMKLYSTFNIPLIHGWLPEVDSPAFVSLKRTAQSYEDAQNMFFHEEELEDKLRREGLSFEEQATLEDIATIKAFFASNATQLTPHGLDTITTSVAPGGVAILFRNDHFSTLYRHPNTLQLLQLVTDMGYAGHEEVVWETLIDVSGENAEFFSGDFRLVGGAPPTPAASQPSNDGWTTVTGRRQNQNTSETYHSARSSTAQQDSIPQSPTTEQEDHDLALALQLQEEEEQRHRNEISRRQRETELSQQYIEQQGQAQNQGNVSVSQRSSTRGRGGPANRGSTRGGASELRPAIPPRRNNTTPAPTPAVQRPQAADPEAGTDAPPPSYEQAATQAEYIPPPTHPSHPNSSPNGAVTGRRPSGYAPPTVAYTGASPVNGRIGRVGRPAGTLIDQIPGRRPTVTGQGQGGQAEQRDRDCIVM